VGKREDILCLSVNASSVPFDLSSETRVSSVTFKTVAVIMHTERKAQLALLAIGLKRELGSKKLPTTSTPPKTTRNRDPVFAYKGNHLHLTGYVNLIGSFG